MTDTPATTAWRPINDAPTDGSPVWVRGRDFGRDTRPFHCLWAYWSGSEWKAAGTDGSTLLYLTEWMPQ